MTSPGSRERWEWGTRRKFKVRLGCGLRKPYLDTFRSGHDYYTFCSYYTDSCSIRLLLDSIHPDWSMSSSKSAKPYRLSEVGNRSSSIAIIHIFGVVCEILSLHSWQWTSARRIISWTHLSAATRIMRSGRSRSPATKREGWQLPTRGMTGSSAF